MISAGAAPRVRCLSARPISVGCSSAKRALISRSAGEKQSSTTAFDFITLTIKKPLGLVLAEKRSTGEVFVEEIAAEGNAAATGQIRVGDVVAKTSAIVLKSSSKDSYGKDGHGARLYDAWETVEFDATGQDFATVISAIGSNNERWGIKAVTLTLRRPAGE